MKKFALTLLFITIFLPLGAQTDIWSGADPLTKAILHNADQLVAQQKYASAFAALGQDDTNEYLVAEKIEYCISYFIQSLEHTMFAFKDFAPGDTFEKLRGGSSGGNFQMVLYDPAKVVAPLLTTSKSKGILYLALGDYYHDVVLRYSGRWLKSDLDLYKLAIDNYKQAYNLGFFTAGSLGNYAEDSMHAGDFVSAVPLLQKALLIDPSVYNADFNLAYALQQTKQYQDSIAAGENAIKKYANDPNYLMDALLMNAASEEALSRGDAAIEYLTRCLAISRQDYRVFQHLGSAYLAQGNIAMADQNLDRLFALAPTNPSASQMVMNVYLYYKHPDALVIFFQRNLSTYKDQPEALGNLNFHLGLQYESMGDNKDALAAARDAKANFTLASTYSSDVSQAVEALIARTTTQTDPAPTK
jgi:tetratricopeptide (TPR) repeat protein